MRKLLTAAATLALVAGGATSAMATTPPIDEGTLTAGYGIRYGVNPLLPPDFPEFHNGVDVAAPVGTELKSIRPGVVKFADWHDGGGGLRTEILHDDGTVSTFSHQNDIFVDQGDTVDEGEVVGTVGTTGNSTGPHLHLELWSNTVEVDPTDLLGIEEEEEPVDHLKPEE